MRPMEAIRQNHFLRTTVAVAAGMLIVPACAAEASHQAEPTSIESTTTTSPKNRLEVSAELNKNDQYSDTASLYIDNQVLGYRTFDDGTPDAKYAEVESHMDGKEKYLPLAEVTLRDNKIVIEDVSPEGIEEDTLSWFGKRLANREELVKEALESGALNSIIFALDDDNYDFMEDRARETGYIFGYYNGKNKTNVFEISTKTYELDAEYFEQYITHEVTHGLFRQSSISDINEATKPDPDTLDKFVKACDDLRTIYAEEARYRLGSVINSLGRFVYASKDPDTQARYAALLNAFTQNSWVEAQPKLGDTNLLFEDKVPNCTFYHLGAMARNLAVELKLPEIGKAAMKGGPDKSMAYYDEAQTALDEFFRTDSIYRMFTEANYQYVSEAMGHPHDNLDELAASTVNILISYPDTLAIKLRYLDEDKKVAVLNVVDVVVGEVVRNHPNLKAYLSEARSKLLEQL
jgi:hypothetical protein